MAINAGDIAFVGVNATNPDQFAILPTPATARDSPMAAALARPLNWPTGWPPLPPASTIPMC